MKKNKNIIKKFPIKIKSNGEWFYKNNLIQKKALIKLFSSVLIADEKGNFFLETPAEKGAIEVEDFPFIITTFDAKMGGSGMRQQAFRLKPVAKYKVLVDLEIS